MEYLEEPVKKEYQRWMDKVGPDDPYVGESTVGLHDVLRAHFLIANHFYLLGENLGGLGPKDINLLNSALYRQHTGYSGTHKWSNKLDVCATLFYGLIKDHAFHDANKRTAFLVLLLHLQKILRYPNASQKVFEDFAVDIADNKLGIDKKYKSKYSKFKKYGQDGTVLFISCYLKSHTREIDKRYYTVTYQQLNTILNKFGFALESPYHNTIDIVKIEKKSKILGLFGSDKTYHQKIGQIGFPGWKSQVGQGAINTVRKKTGLRPENDVDSKIFFHDADPLPALIATYHEPLRRLAKR